MRLFSFPDGTVDRLDRASILTCPFDLSFAVAETPDGETILQRARPTSFTISSRGVSFPQRSRGIVFTQPDR